MPRSKDKFSSKNSASKRKKKSKKRSNDDGLSDEIPPHSSCSKDTDSDDYDKSDGGFGTMKWMMTRILTLGRNRHDA